ncbi:SMEK domain-containing protein [Pseudomonas avellanae]|uniref:SMEK domain-containing protein n=1 Tax=Pseudomonas avellanae TaxID=46257 RepID=UPI000465DF15|nr:SMEK domain-containing protein [Pseudomonas avellanae]
MADLTLSGLSKILSTEIALLKHFLEIQKSSGFSEASRIVELLARELFTAAGYGEFKDAHLKKINQEAFDLYDDKSRSVVQVTANAGSVKLRKTIAAFEKKNKQGKSLLDSYDKFYVWGVNSAQKGWAKCPAYCEILDSDYLIAKLVSDANVDSLSKAINAIRKHQCSSLLLMPYSDVNCLSVVLGVMNRSAIKHSMACEGSIERMRQGLFEVQEIIGKGCIKGCTVTKTISEYSSTAIIKFLRQVQDDISEIDAVLNSATYEEFCSLSFEQNNKINELKENIISAVNSISKECSLDFSMSLTRV